MQGCPSLENSIKTKPIKMQNEKKKKKERKREGVKERKKKRIKVYQLPLFSN